MLVLFFLILYKLRLINTTNTLIVLGGHSVRLNNSKT
nr:MAG TPA: Triple gene block 3 [Crassvirales sp.]